MVDVEDILVSVDGQTHRVDAPKLVLFLRQLSDDMSGLRGEIVAHMKAEEENQKNVKELVSILQSFRIIMRVGKWLGGLATAIGSGYLMYRKLRGLA